MRLRNDLALILMFMLPAIAAAQTNSYLGGNYTPSDTVIRPASTTMWRNYVTVPDGPCGCPMSVEADCYNPTCRPCGPLHPVCFFKRVHRMLDCLLPCNLCCSGCGCGLFHGCHLGGRTWGHCSVCCGGGGACGGCGAGGCGGNGCGACSGCGNCGLNPAGSVFDPPCCSCGQCGGCSCGAGVGCCDSAAPPMLSDPFQDDPAPPMPKPTSLPATEVRRAPINQTKPVSAPARQAISSKESQPAKQTVAANTSPYKIVNQQTAAPLPKTTIRRPSSTITATEEVRTVPAQSVLRRASVETETVEPAPHNINRARALPIVRSQSPETIDNDIPANPLR